MSVSALRRGSESRARFDGRRSQIELNGQRHERCSVDRFVMRLLEYARFAAARVKVRAVPWALGFELTHRCNLACHYCDRHTPLPGEMTYEQIVMVLAELYVLGMRHVSLDGGEPLTHRHVNDI